MNEEILNYVDMALMLEAYDDALEAYEDALDELDQYLIAHGAWT